MHMERNYRMLEGWLRVFFAYRVFCVASILYVFRSVLECQNTIGYPKEDSIFLASLCIMGVALVLNVAVLILLLWKDRRALRIIKITFALSTILDEISKFICLSYMEPVVGRNLINGTGILLTIIVMFICAMYLNSSKRVRVYFDEKAGDVVKVSIS